MEVDPSLPGRGGWCASPPSASGGRITIHRRMKFVAHRLAN